MGYTTKSIIGIERLHWSWSIESVGFVLYEYGKPTGVVVRATNDNGWKWYVANIDINPRSSYYPAYTAMCAAERYYISSSEHLNSEVWKSCVSLKENK